ncbi:MAG: hypothetical protein ACO1OQ_01300 [Rufibacter sp.]
MARMTSHDDVDRENQSNRITQEISQEMPFNLQLETYKHEQSPISWLSEK